MGFWQGTDLSPKCVSRCLCVLESLVKAVQLCPKTLGALVHMDPQQTKLTVMPVSPCAFLVLRPWAQPRDGLCFGGKSPCKLHCAWGAEVMGKVV